MYRAAVFPNEAESGWFGDNFFVEEDGRPKVMKFAWPKSPIYFLDWHKPQAVVIGCWGAIGNCPVPHILPKLLPHTQGSRKLMLRSQTYRDVPVEASI